MFSGILSFFTSCPVGEGEGEGEGEGGCDAEVHIKPNFILMQFMNSFSLQFFTCKYFTCFFTGSTNSRIKRSISVA